MKHTRDLWIRRIETNETRRRKRSSLFCSLLWASLKTGLNRENRQGASAARKADEARLYALRGGVTRCCEAKAQSDGTDAVATKLSLVDRSRRRALLILSQTRFLEVTGIKTAAGTSRRRIFSRETVRNSVLHSPEKR